MIKYIHGDAVKALQEGQITVLVHGVNCHGVMGSGIAKQVKETFPECFHRYEHFVWDRKVNGFPVQVGELVNWQRNGRMIVNLFSQSNYGYDGERYCSYDGIEMGLRNLKNNFLNEGDIVAMPKIGAGLGGGDWKIIESIINSVFGDREVLVYELEQKKYSSQNGDIA